MKKTEKYVVTFKRGIHGPVTVEAEDAEAAILAAWPLDTELPAGISAVQCRLQTVDLPGKYPHVLIVEQSAPVKAAGK